MAARGHGPARCGRRRAAQDAIAHHPSEVLTCLSSLGFSKCARLLQGELTRQRADLRLREASDAALRKQAAALRAEAAAAAAAAAEDRRRAAAEHARAQAHAAALERDVRCGARVHVPDWQGVRNTRPQGLPGRACPPGCTAEITAARQPRDIKEVASACKGAGVGGPCCGACCIVRDANQRTVTSRSCGGMPACLPALAPALLLARLTAHVGRGCARADRTPSIRTQGVDASCLIGLR